MKSDIRSDLSSDRSQSQTAPTVALLSGRANVQKTFEAMKNTLSMQAPGEQPPGEKMLTRQVKGTFDR
ncbi:hypothetical protein GCM10011363_45590 [Marivita lacus]|uniref:Uncharacterized protein n=1 Tax=Marivita lacus TaxID=1323742 RepID=A0ABQ1LJ86_9RHOB|nr:hypothetical protein GCM10011363_45590 [Marivita lacus]